MAKWTAEKLLTFLKVSTGSNLTECLVNDLKVTESVAGETVKAYSDAEQSGTVYRAPGGRQYYDSELGAMVTVLNRLKIPTAGLADSGDREQHATGAHREPEGERGNFTLLPFEAMQAVAAHFTKGGEKYGDAHNYRKGLPYTRFLSSAVRHLLQYAAGLEGEDHLSAAACNIVMLLQTRADVNAGRLPATLDDRFKAGRQ